MKRWLRKVGEIAMMIAVYGALAALLALALSCAFSAIAWHRLPNK